MAKKYKVVQKFVVQSDYFNEVKTFSNEYDANVYANMLNEVYEEAMDEGMKEGIKKGREEAAMEAIRDNANRVPNGWAKADV